MKIDDFCKTRKQLKEEQKSRARCRTFQEMVDLLQVDFNKLRRALQDENAPKPVDIRSKSKQKYYRTKEFVSWWLSLTPEVRLHIRKKVGG